MHLLSNFYPNPALIDMNAYLYSSVQRPDAAEIDTENPHLLDHRVATRILRLLTNIVELGGEDREISGPEVDNLVESIMPDMLLRVNGTENGVQSPRNSRINYQTLLDNICYSRVSFISTSFHCSLLVVSSVFHLDFRILI